MQIIERNGLKILTPALGFKLVTKDYTRVCDNEVYLNSTESSKYYTELSIEEATQLKMRLKEQRRLKYENNTH